MVEKRSAGESPSVWPELPLGEAKSPHVAVVEMLSGLELRDKSAADGVARRLDNLPCGFRGLDAEPVLLLLDSFELAPALASRLFFPFDVVLLDSTAAFIIFPLPTPA